MKKILKLTAIFILCLTVTISKINAKSYITDLFQSGEIVIIVKELDGTAFILGENVKLNKKINGIGFIAGNKIDINSNQEYLFGLSTDINIKNDIEKDLFLFSSTVNINSNIKRDAYIAGEDINLNGNVTRNIYIYGTDVNLNGTFNGNVTINSINITIDKDTKISGTLKYNKDANIKGLKDNIKVKTYEQTETLSFKDYIINFINSYIHITLLGIVLVYILEKTFKKSLNQTKELSAKNILTLCGKGFLILVGVPIIVMILIFSGLFVSVGVVGGLIYGLLVYISNIFTAYSIAHYLDQFYLKKNMNSYLLVIIGLFIIYVISIIPVLGSLLSFLFMLLGLGITGNMIIELKK